MRDPVYTAATEADAKARFAEFTERWGRPYPAITKLWQNAWSEFVPFLTDTPTARAASDPDTPTRTRQSEPG